MIADLMEQRRHGLSHSSLDIEGILAYRHRAVVARYATEQGVPTEDAEAVFQETKKFLGVCAQSGGGEDYAPSKEQDAMWHLFILYTRDYTQFCSTFFGAYLHHVPCDGTRAWADPCPLKEKAVTIFGEILPGLWPGRPTDMMRCCGYC